jgi:RNA polymerase primary sigma factor
MELRYGLPADADHTLEQIGRKLGVTRERARQIEEQALNKLRILLRPHLGEDPFA